MLQQSATSNNYPGNTEHIQCTLTIYITLKLLSRAYKVNGTTLEFKEIKAEAVLSFFLK